MDPSWIDYLLDMFIPNQCVLCGALDSTGLCSTCLYQFPVNPWISLNQAHHNNFWKILPEAKLDYHTSPYLQSILAIGSFKSPSIRHSIHMFKYKNLPQLGYPLSRVMLHTLVKFIYPHRKPILCPIPLHQTRLRFRGYNQSLILAEHLAHDLEYQIITTLQRIQKTRAQMNLAHRKDRIQNVKNAFYHPPITNLNPQSILIIDDVTTSLSTLKESAKALYKAGFTDIHALVIGH